jgi:hypothetical protein
MFYIFHGVNILPKYNSSSSLNVAYSMALWLHILLPPPPVSEKVAKLINKTFSNDSLQAADTECGALNFSPYRVDRYKADMIIEQYDRTDAYNSLVWKESDKTCAVQLRSAFLFLRGQSENISFSHSLILCL